MRSKIPPEWPAGIQLLPAHFGQRPRNAMFFPQSGQMMTREWESSNFCSPSASRLLRKEDRLVNVSSPDIATPTAVSAWDVPQEHIRGRASAVSELPCALSLGFGGYVGASGVKR